MSVTFFLGSAETLHPSCPDCGKSARDPNYTDCDREDCLGYGPDSVSNTPELNIGNANARAFLRVLGLDSSDLWGEIDPADAKRRLAVSAMRISGETRAPFAEGNMISAGLSEDQLGRYCARLFTLATLAERRGEPILYG